MNGNSHKLGAFPDSRNPNRLLVLTCSSSSIHMNFLAFTGQLNVAVVHLSPLSQEAPTAAASTAAVTDPEPQAAVLIHSASWAVVKHLDVILGPDSHLKSRSLICRLAVRFALLALLARKMPGSWQVKRRCRYVVILQQNGRASLVIGRTR